MRASRVRVAYVRSPVESERGRAITNKRAEAAGRAKLRGCTIGYIYAGPAASGGFQMTTHLSDREGHPV